MGCCIRVHCTDALAIERARVLPVCRVLLGQLTVLRGLQCTRVQIDEMGNFMDLSRTNLHGASKNWLEASWRSPDGTSTACVRCPQVRRDAPSSMLALQKEDRAGLLLGADCTRGHNQSKTHHLFTARYGPRTWRHRFHGRARCTCLRRAIRSPLSGSASSGLGHVGPALRLPHHSAVVLSMLRLTIVARPG